MRPIKLLLLFLAFGQMLSAGTDLRSRLIDLNNQWAYRTADLLFVENAHVRYSEKELIQKHLFLAHQRLSEKDISSLSAIQLKNRRQGLAHLLEYAERGSFPQNITHQYRRPVFIDHRGVHCAVGYLIMKSGNAELSNRISANMNYHYLKEMEDLGLSEWVGQSGFSVDELAWMQPSYGGPAAWESMKGGVNGPVNTIMSNNAGGILAAGFFDTADTWSVDNLAEWYAGATGYDWMNFDGGTDGPIYTMLRHQGEIYIGGEFYNIDGTPTGAPVAKYDGSSWTGLGDFYVGALNNKVNDLEIYRDTLYAAGLFRVTDGSGAFFNIAKWNGTEWLKAASDTALPDQMMGAIHTLHVHDGKLVAGGQFELPNGAKNIFAINGNTLEKFGEQIPNSVHALETHNGELYVGSRYLSYDSQDTVGLSVYRNGEWERLTGAWDFVHKPAHTAVLALESTPHGLVLGGAFSHVVFVGDFYHNIAIYEDGDISSLGSLDSSVTALHFESGALHVGGQFTSGRTPNGDEPLGHITRVYLPDVGEDELTAQSLKVFPNPAHSRMNIENLSGREIDKLRIYDMKGTAVEVPYRHQKKGTEVDVSGLTPGSYFLKVNKGAAVLQEKILIAD